MPTKYHVNEKILEFLRNNPKYSYNAPTIYKHFKGRYKINTIRSELRRLCETKKILRETHGFYRIIIDSEILYYLENPPTLLHGIMVSMEWLRKLQNRIHGITFDKGINETTLTRLKNIGFVEKSNHRCVLWFDYQDDIDRRVTITVHRKGRIDLYINCSNHPINYFEFRDILKYCEGKIDFLGKFMNQRVIQFGVAKDFREIRMDGVNSLTLRAFMNSWFRVYNKERLGVMRIEQHIKCNVPTDMFITMFERMFLPVGNGVVHKEDDGVDVT